jgi:hypothetical protein
LFIEVIIISILIAFLRGGKLNNLTYVRIKGIGFMILGLVIYSISIRYIANTNNEISKILFSNLSIINIITFGLILFGLYKIKYIWNKNIYDWNNFKPASHYLKWRANACVKKMHLKN